MKMFLQVWSIIMANRDMNRELYLYEPTYVNSKIFQTNLNWTGLNCCKPTLMISINIMPLKNDYFKIGESST